MSASRPYGLGRQELSWMFGGNVAPSAHTTELGVRLGDVVGRLDTIAVVSLGRPHGAALATVWRGWPVGLGLHLYDVQKERGAELRAFWSAQFPLQSISVAGGLLHRSAGVPPASRGAGGTPAFLEGAFRARQLGGSMRTTEELRVAAESDHHIRAVVRGTATLAGIRLGATYERDHGDVTVGGVQTSILPRSAVASRVLDPALPIATLAADHYEGRRIDATLGGVTAFYQQHRTRDRLALAGLEINLRGDAMPLIKTPAYDLTAGAARILDAPFERRIRWWIGLRWHP